MNDSSNEKTLYEQVLREVKLTSSTDSSLLPSVAEAAVSNVPDVATGLEGFPQSVPELKPLASIVVVGLFMAAISTNVLMGMSTAAGVERQMVVDFPLHLLWTYTMLSLNADLATVYRRKAPMHYLSICVISCVSLLCVPVFDQYHLNRLLDPFFYLWLLCQMIFPFICAYWIGRNEEPSNKSPWKFPLVLTLCANVYLVFGLFSPIFSDNIVGFSVGWLVCQFGMFAYLNRILKRRNKRVREEAPGGQFPQKVGKDVVLRYREYAGIERWFKHRFKRKSASQSMLQDLLFCFSPVILVGLMLCAYPLLESASFKRQPTGAISIRPTRPNFGVEFSESLATPMANFERDFFLFCTGSVAFLMLVLVVAYRKRPNHLALNDEGLRLMWRRGTWTRDGKVTSWSDVKSIGMDRKKRIFGSDEAITFFVKAGPPFAIPVSAIESPAEREALLQAIQLNVPMVPRDAKVIESLQPRADHSYTELWLQALTAPPQRERLQPLHTGAQLRDGSYRILGTIGVGGQGQAYLAQAKSGSRVVLKEFLLPVYVDVDVRKSALEQFQNEAQILRSLEHEHVVKLEDFFIEDHRAYLVLEHIDGLSLRQLVANEGKLDEATVRDLALQMCGILEYLHGLSPPVVHRDFTPDNLILRKSGQLVLIDFNVAKQLQESTAIGTVVGKHAYLPPEQFRGEPEAASDIYAMGCTLHFLLTGADPEPVSMSSPRQLDDTLSENIDSVVRKSTMLSLTKRYSNVAEVRKALSVQ